MKENNKIEVQLSWENWNIFNLLGIVKLQMKKAGQLEEFKQLITEVRECKSYEEALAVIEKFVDIV